MISRFQVVALAFGPLVNITTKSLTIVRVADEIKEMENSLKNRIIRKLKSMWKKPSTSDANDVSSNQEELISVDDEGHLENENDPEEDTKKDR